MCRRRANRAPEIAATRFLDVGDSRMDTSDLGRTKTNDPPHRWLRTTPFAIYESDAYPRFDTEVETLVCSITAPWLAPQWRFRGGQHRATTGVCGIEEERMPLRCTMLTKKPVQRKQRPIFSHEIESKSRPRQRATGFSQRGPANRRYDDRSAVRLLHRQHSICGFERADNASRAGPSSAPVDADQ